MDTLDFLQRVLPSEGTYCSLVLTGKARRQRFHNTVEELRDVVLEADSRGQNTFFAISTFADRSSRKQVNVSRTKVLTVDVDCGADKPYKDWKEGLKALLAFLKSSKMPVPLVIKSGNGLHVYWVLDEELPPDEWKPLAMALKSAVAEYEFEVDPVTVANSALVLRPVGTYNHKDKNNPKLVRVLTDGGDTTVAAVHKALQYYYKQPAPKRKVNSQLLDNLAVHNDLPPANAHTVEQKCKQVHWAVHHQDRVSEPLWYSLIGVAAYCEHPENTAKRWSEQHPGYSEQETLAKLQHWRESTTGPATCAKFEAERPQGCAGCAFAGKVGTPVRLGAQHEEAVPEAAPSTTAYEVKLPKLFKRTAKGIMLVLDGTDIPICGFDVYPVSYGYDSDLGYETARFMWQRPHVGWRPLVLRNAHLADGLFKEFVGSIADQGVVLESRKQTEYFQIMLRSYMEELKRVQTVTDMRSNMGWSDTFDEFVIGNDLYRRQKDGTVTKEDVSLGGMARNTVADMFTTSGSQKAWFSAVRSLDKAGMRAQQYSIAVGFASVLFAFTGLKGVTISFCGPSGSGKTLAQYMQQSVWGNPDKLHFQSKFTQNVLFNRFGVHGNLPMTIDEATVMSDRDVGEYLYWVSQGRDKARLTRSASERPAREWALTSTLSTNEPMADKLMLSGTKTDAQLARLIELRVDIPKILRMRPKTGRVLYEVFNTNYGHAGREFVQRLMQLGADEVRKMIEDAFADFPSVYGYKFSGTERYWEQAIVLPDLAMELAHDWGILPFGPSKVTQWVLDQLTGMRDAYVDVSMTPMERLVEYFNKHADTMARVYHTTSNGAVVDIDTLPKQELRIRLDLYKGARGVVEHGTAVIDKMHLKRWLAEQGVGIADLIVELQKLQLDVTPKSGNASVSRYTPLARGQVRVLCVSLMHPLLVSMLGYDAGGPKVDAARKGISVVSSQAT